MLRGTVRGCGASAVMSRLRFIPAIVVLSILLRPAAGQAAALTVTAAHASGIVRPGDAGHVHLTVRISNGAILGSRLTLLRVTNLTAGPGTQAQRDAEVGTLR